MSYNRVLPRPVPLYDASQARFPSWSNDLLKYKIVNDEGPTRLSLVNWSIDDDLCGYPDRGPATEPPQVHFASKGPSGSIGRIDSDPPVASPRLKVPAFTRTLPMPTRNSQVGKCSSCRPVKSAASRELLAQSCLCRTGPKIPRPKNAFFLYRQRYQAAVVAQNPGLGSADISRIIGAQWRTLSEETKNGWHALANEEKARHQQRYSEYRYQPRRYGRGGNSLAMRSGVSQYSACAAVCNRCGGRVTTPPVSLETRFTPEVSLNAGSPQPDAAMAGSSQRQAGDSDSQPNHVQFEYHGGSHPPRETGYGSPDSKLRRFDSHIAFEPNVHHDRSLETPYPMPPCTRRVGVSNVRVLRHVNQSIIGNGRVYPQNDPSLKLPPPLQITAPLPSSIPSVTRSLHNGSSPITTVMALPALTHQSSRQDVTSTRSVLP
ncbi:slightly ste11-like protein [Aspergillus fumigatus]|nr:hypothetical protein KXX44_008268 [Aspergillus fumigatus]KAH1837379.1 hypothetical protein KXX55_006023 [Aspergillus fumigatus]KAH2977109.1 hypothetical protein KXW58_006073 [Aspergillus fumigatus]KAH3034142.1 hypothetical protein KXW01_006464 [Aspergillus fumigatus]KAH3313187.1 hypothetical protein KXW17_005718 [Aspergillus fumigatus]